MSNVDTLALLGGKPINEKPFQFNNAIGEEERRAVLAVLDRGELSGFIASPGEPFWGGEAVRELQRMFCEHYGMKHAVAVNSATSGLLCALSATGIGPGDEVITSPYTMSATSTVALMLGAVPVFADIEEETFGIDPASVEANITPHTKAIIAVNIFGHAARLTELRVIADRHGLFLIEDNAQAPDALHQGRLTGTIGDLSVFSFNRHKTMQSGEGGVVLTNSDKLFEKAALMRNHGEAVLEGFGIDDLVNAIGLNLRMTELEAAVAIEQFKKLPRLNAEREVLARRLDDGMGSIDGITAPYIGEGNRHVYYMYAMKYDAARTGLPRDLFVKAMLAEGLFIRGGYLKPTYLYPTYQKRIAIGDKGFPFTANPRSKNLSYAEGLCPVCERLENRELMITAVMQPPQTLEDMDRYIAGIRKVLSNRDALLKMAA